MAAAVKAAHHAASNEGDEDLRRSLCGDPAQQACDLLGGGQGPCRDEVYDPLRSHLKLNRRGGRYLRLRCREVGLHVSGVEYAGFRSSSSELEIVHSPNDLFGRPLRQHPFIADTVGPPSLTALLPEPVTEFTGQDRGLQSRPGPSVGQGIAGVANDLPQHLD